MQVCHWEVTRSCNLSCLHCIYGGTTGADMGTAMACQAIDRLREAGCEVLCLTGGEPLTRGDLAVLLRRASGVGLKIALITNGTLLDRCFLDAAGQYLSGVCFSIDGLREVHDRLRGKGCFDRTVYAMDIVQSYGGINVSASVTVTALNIATIDETFRWLAQRELTGIHVNDLNMIGSALIHRRVLGLDWDDRTKEVLLTAIRSISDSDEMTESSACFIVPEVACLSYDGQVYPCSELMTSRTAPMGSIFDLVPVRGFPEVPLVCKYTDYKSGCISVTLHNGYACPLRREGV